MNHRYVTDNIFKIQKIDKEKLLSNNFHLYSIRGENASELYYYRFPVYKYKNYPVLNCEILINICLEYLVVNVYDKNNRLFAPFYYSQYGNYEKILCIIRNNIFIKLSDMGILVI
ncbi:MAG: hypothetical protein K2M78_11965 [Lachnospiraceae bacterium]|nr:hypothetical protein [Lachnospiraceae bacterium]